jgi:hypothetical protein
MKFEDVLKNIESLSGKKLLCISPHAMPLEIIKVDWESKRVLVRAGNGAELSRSFQELEKVWNALQELPAVHVDSDALHGGGSMRNQPETIFANLPYIEFLTIERKKHLVWVSEETHALGTLRQMDPIQAQEVIVRRKKQCLLEAPPSAVLVTDDLKTEIDNIIQLTGITPDSIPGQQGLYKMYKMGCRTLMVNKTLLPKGTYIVLKCNHGIGDRLDFEVDGYQFFWPKQGARNLLVVACT